MRGPCRTTGCWPTARSRLSARTAAARLLLKHGDNKNALALLDDYAAQNPEESIEVGAARAQLLAQAGDVDAALQGLDALLQRYPDHPNLDLPARHRA